MPMASLGSDPSELAIPWQALRAAGHEVVIATPDGKPGQADPRMLSGQGLGPWKPLLRATKAAQQAYRELANSAEFLAPRPYADCAAIEDWDALLLPGGHDKPIREYLESPLLHALTASFFAARKPVAAICHGVLVAARARDSVTGRSVLHGRKTTSLTKRQELLAYGMTRLWLADYYRTYDLTTEDEVRSFLADPADYLEGPLPLLRDDPLHLQRGFVVQDGIYVSARWPGDAHRFSATFIDLLRDA